MNRRILLQVTAPALLIGLLLLAACVGGAWSSYRLQRNLDTIRSQSVRSLNAALELEISLRQLRYHSIRYLIDPTAQNLETIDVDQNQFNQSLKTAKQSAQTAAEEQCVAAIEKGYGQYEQDMARFRADVLRRHKPVDFRKLDQEHPIRNIVEPCRKLLDFSKQHMDQMIRESDAVSRQARLIMMLLGVGGPLGGILCGYGIARALSRSIYNLSVRVKDISQRLDQDLASVSVSADGDLTHLDRQLQGVVERVEEVAERVQRQQREMLRAEQLSAVGQLAASVAHEVRNPLTSVKLLVEAAKRPANRKPLSQDDLQVIHGAVCRLEQTVQSFLDFARLPTPSRKLTDLRGIIDQAVDLVRARARQQGVEIAVRRPEQPVVTEVDGGQLCTVLVNLLLNSLDALPERGSIAIDLQAARGEQISLTVSDSGPGISPEMMSRLFVPFASSKPTGTGLGLSISRRILEEHGGTITAANQPGGGARFTITLPATALPESSVKQPLALGASHADPVSY
ncbi:MAG TPA: ATP-binding protein [Gemmataceae bacterium]|nr:ATP-binding protein [Gemmataceae bacterium]